MRHFKILSSASTMAACLILAGPAFSQVILGAADGSSEDDIGTVTAFAGNVGGYTMAGDVFTSAITSIGNSIQFYGTGGGPTETFTAYLYSADTGAPGTAMSASPIVGVTRASSSNPLLDYFTGTLVVPFSFDAGTTYYVGVSASTTFSFGLNDGGYGEAYAYESPTFTQLGDSEHVVTLDLAVSHADNPTPPLVPEPSEVALLLLGTAVWALWNWRRKVSRL